MGRYSLWILVALTFLTICLHGTQGSQEVGPSESECQPYIAKALHELKSSVAGSADADIDGIQANDSKQSSSDEINDTREEDIINETEEDTSSNTQIDESQEKVEESESQEKVEENESLEKIEENEPLEKTEENGNISTETIQSRENDEHDENNEQNTNDQSTEKDSDSGSIEAQNQSRQDIEEKNVDESQDDTESSSNAASERSEKETPEVIANLAAKEGDESDETDNSDEDKSEDDTQEKNNSDAENKHESEEIDNKHTAPLSEEDISGQQKSKSEDNDEEQEPEGTDNGEDSTEKNNGIDDKSDESDKNVNISDDVGNEDTDSEDSDEGRPEDDLLLRGGIPENLRDRRDINELLQLDENKEKEEAQKRVSDIILRDLKNTYENAIRPLETLYKYRDLSNRHFGDSEIFSKSLVLLMGPWSGGKSTIINYLTGNEHTENALRSGAEPSPAYFNIVMHGDNVEVLDGTQLVADWTFSGLQKFGQGLEERLRGLKLPNNLLKMVNIVEIPGILEVRKQVSRVFPFNDACQWFIDRADIILLVYDPTKLDVGPETEAILDQLKGREYQTRIILNKADLIQPEELLRVQSALIWNISPLMSSAQPPAMYTTSLWSHPYEKGSPERLLRAQERALLRDLRTAIDKRIENKIASARRFAVRVRNHAKMVDCYLTTYYNHKSLFGNKKRISDQIIENPQNYHIYEGLSTLTNISRYDLPDPEVYRDFFRLNPLYEFKKLSETCTYFRGCPINKLDVAIAYDLPELIGKYKKMMESSLNKLDSTSTNGEGS